MIEGIEIFSGAGGLATGLGMSGVNHNAFVEWNPDACKTLRENYDENLIFEGDIRDFDFSRHAGIDIIAGGPPCQPFSLGGKAKGNEDSRDMFPSAIRSIRELLPKVFFFENVKGLLRSSFSEYLHYILLQLRYPTVKNSADDWRTHVAAIKRLAKTIAATESYEVSVCLVNAADYGIPQRRERVVIIGVRKDLEGNGRFQVPLILVIPFYGISMSLKSIGNAIISHHLMMNLQSSRCKRRLFVINMVSSRRS